MIKMIRKIFWRIRRLIRLKVYVQRTLTYISIVNTMMILFLTLSELDKYGLDINIKKWYVPIIIIFVLILMLIGYLDFKLGVYSEEQGFKTGNDPNIRRIRETVTRLEEKIENLNLKK